MILLVFLVKGGKMVKKNSKNLIGAWGFLIGVLLAIAIGLFSSYLGAETYKIILFVLIGLGIIVGLLNVNVKEISGFLLAGLALVVVSFFGQATLSIIPQVGAILGSLLVLFVPAVIIVALKVMFQISKD